MAHECPDCGMTCYCGGDIDDLLLNDHDDVIHCTHYQRRECDGFEGDEDEEFADEDSGLPPRSAADDDELPYDDGEAWSGGFAENH